MPADIDAAVPSGRIDTYRVEPDRNGEGDWHILTFENGVQVQIYTTAPLLVLAPETM